MLVFRNKGTAHVSTRPACVTSVQTECAAGSFMAAPLLYQLHRRLADPGVAGVAGAVEALAPGERGDVAILVHGFVGDEAEALAQRCARVGVGAVIEQQAGEG